MKIKDILLGIAITILTFLVVFAGIQTFYSYPDSSDFCGEYKYERYPQIADKENSTDIVCAQDVRECPDETFVSRDPKQGCNFPPCSDEYTDCWDEYENSRKAYSKNLFVITLIIGIIILGIGTLLFKLESVGGGVMGGAVITLIYGAGSYWPNADNLFRFIISLIGLALVISFAYWLNKRK
jgi:hypothetical protein